MRSPLAQLAVVSSLLAVVATGAAGSPLTGGAAAKAEAVEGVWTEPSYASVFKDSGPSADSGDAVRLDMARGESESAQIVLRPDEATHVDKVRFSDLANGAATIPSSRLSSHYLDFTELDHNSVFGDDQQVYPVTRKAPGAFPDALSNDTARDVAAGATQPVWITAQIPEDTAAGVYTGTATLETDKGDIPVPVSVDVRDVTLPAPDQGAFTNSMWTLFFGDLSYEEEPTESIKKWYGIDRYSPEWWELLGNVAGEMKSHRTNDLAIPLVRSLLDAGSKLNADGSYDFDFSRFDEVVQFFLDRGMTKRIEGFWEAGGPNYDTHWDMEIIASEGRKYVPYDSAEATNWTDQFIPALRDHIKAKGWDGKWWMHVGDEPQGDHGLQAWTDIAKTIRSHWPDVKLGDAIFHEPTAGKVAEQEDVLIPNLLNYNTDPEVYDAEHAKGKELWLYNCNVPVANYLNRFIDQPQWNQRLTPWYAYTRGATGYLHWALDNWPFALEDQEVKGDGYITLPDKEHRTIKSTVRYESLRDGIEDYEVLALLGKKDPALAKGLAKALVQKADKYTPDTGYMQRIRALALDAAAGKPVVADDLARDAKATASAGDAARAVDGDGATSWSADGDSQWLQLDLGRQVQLDGVHMKWGDAPESYKLKLSYDGKKWTEVDSGTTAFAGVNGKARYLRLEADGPFSLSDFEATGQALQQPNLAGGRGYEVSAPTWDKAPDATGIESTDGVLADDWEDGRSYGFQGADGKTKSIEVTLDLGEARSVAQVRAHAYEEYPAYRPDGVKVLTSTDGTDYAERADVQTANGPSGVWYDLRFAETQARYVKIVFTKKYGGDATEMFLDEIETYGTAS